MNEKLAKQIVDNWMKDSRDTIPFPNIMNELLEFGSKISDNFLKAKANRIYIKCLRAKKLQLADKISKKYNLESGRKSDSIIAFEYNLMAIAEKLNKDGK